MRIAALSAALAGCGSHQPVASSTSSPAAPPAAQSPPDTQPAAATAVAPAARPGKPEIGAWGFDLDGMDRSAAPGADFYRFANGHWLATTQIPPDKPAFAMFSALADRSRERTREILQAASGPPGSDEQRIGDYYRAFMDEAAIEARGTAPIQPELDAIAQIRDKAGLIARMAVAARRFDRNPFFVLVDVDDRVPGSHIANLGQSGLGLPDRDMYDAKTAQFAALRAAYRTYLATLFTLIGVPDKDAERRAAAVYALEEKLARTHWTRVQNRDPQKTYNKLTPAELQKLAPGIDWKPWLAAVGLAGQSHLNVNQPSAIAGEAALIQSQPLAVWKDYLVLHLVDDAAPFLPRRFVDARFELYGKTLSGSQELEERWKRAVDRTTDALGEAIGKSYVARYFTPDTKARAEQLVGNLLTAMGQRLDGLSWMSPETKAKARAKLATYRVKIGYPDRWRDYSALTVVAGDPLGNAERAAAFDYDRRLAKLGKPIDRDEWELPPMTVNAYYNPTRNEIVFPAAILQPPFFDPSADDAVNYGSIGAVIGHEISHGFDDQGSQYDADGALKNWWTKDDAEKFKAATSRLVAQYSAYCPIPARDGKPAQCVKGELTLGENIADLAGITIAYNAYHLALGGKPAPVLDGFTGDQRFFLAFAQAWRGKYRDAELARRLVVDVHSPGSLRATTVRNVAAWYDAFQPRPGDALYLAPDQRVQIW